MSPLVERVTWFVSFATIIADLGIAYLFISLLFKRQNATVAFIARHALWISFAATSIGIATSLFYSEVASFLPCTLCWWQRIFLYPQVLLFGVGLLWRKKDAGDYGLALSLFGALVAIYHTYLQFGGSLLVPCSTSGASCAQRYFLEFGYVTIPTMSLTVFLFLIVTVLVQKVYGKTGETGTG